MSQKGSMFWKYWTIAVVVLVASAGFSCLSTRNVADSTAEVHPGTDVSISLLFLTAATQGDFGDHSERARIAWRAKEGTSYTGHGHGSYMTVELARLWLKYLNSDPNLEYLEHWLEFESQ